MILEVNAKYLNCSPPPVDAANVDGGHGSVGRHAALGGQLLEAGERALRGEGVRRRAREERVRTVDAAVTLHRLLTEPPRGRRRRHRRRCRRCRAGGALGGRFTLLCRRQWRLLRLRRRRRRREDHADFDESLRVVGRFNAFALPIIRY